MLRHRSSPSELNATEVEEKQSHFKDLNTYFMLETLPTQKCLLSTYYMKVVL